MYIHTLGVKNVKNYHHLNMNLQRHHQHHVYKHRLHKELEQQAQHTYDKHLGLHSEAPVRCSQDIGACNSPLRCSPPSSFKFHSQSFSLSLECLQLMSVCMVGNYNPSGRSDERTYTSKQVLRSNLITAGMVGSHVFPPDQVWWLMEFGCESLCFFVHIVQNMKNLFLIVTVFDTAIKESSI